MRRSRITTSAGLSMRKCIAILEKLSGERTGRCRVRPAELQPWRARKRAMSRCLRVRRPRESSRPELWSAPSWRPIEPASPSAKEFRALTHGLSAALGPARSELWARTFWVAIVQQSVAEAYGSSTECGNLVGDLVRLFLPGAERG
jgi:hypothetical protein